MESNNNNSSNIVYTKDQLLEIRAAFISSGGPSLYPVRFADLLYFFSSLHRRRCSLNKNDLFLAIVEYLVAD